MKQATCHPEKRAICKGLCRCCYEKQLREKNPEFAERQRENSRSWTLKNKDRKKEYDKRRRERVGPESEKRFNRYLNKKFNITRDKYNNIVDSQNNKCAICGRGPAENGKKLHLDHCHKTNKIRGLLCAQCNWYLGFIEKDYTILNKILQYLKINLDGSSKEI